MAPLNLDLLIRCVACHYFGFDKVRENETLCRRLSSTSVFRYSKGQAEWHVIEADVYRRIPWTSALWMHHFESEQIDWDGSEIRDLAEMIVNAEIRPNFRLYYKDLELEIGFETLPEGQAVPSPLVGLLQDMTPYDSTLSLQNLSDEIIAALQESIINSASSPSPKKKRRIHRQAGRKKAVVLVNQQLGG